jgi:hypothetical protein
VLYRFLPTTFKKKFNIAAGGVAQVAEHLPSKCVALISYPTTTRERERERERERNKETERKK